MSDSSRFVRSNEGNVAVLDPRSIKLLDTFTREALDDLDERRRIIETLPSPLRGPARVVLAKADELAAAVAWKTSHLLQRLGCDIATQDDLGKLSKDGLQRCEASLKVVGKAMALQDRRADRRHVVRMFGTLLRQVDELPAPRPLREALDAGDFTAWQYLELGEIATAERLAARVQRGDDVRPDPRNPYAALPSAHLSPARIEAYLRGDAEALGPNVLKRVRKHVEGDERHRPCARCASVAADVKRLARSA